MSLWLTWVALWILFIIVEIFLLTLDFLAIWISAVITWVIAYYFWFSYNDVWILWFIFLILSVLSIFITRKFIYPSLKEKIWEKDVLSVDNIVWQHMIVQYISGQMVIHFDGIYWNVISEDELKQWDSVEVIEIVWNKLKVKKLF